MLKMRSKHYSLEYPKGYIAGISPELCKYTIYMYINVLNLLVVSPKQKDALILQLNAVSVKLKVYGWMIAYT